tara:strand:+ start:367 stop:873 length:507 start_codon:yes stop_codon:yes gene_type:complete
MKKIKLLIALLAFCLGAISQPVPVVVECTEGEFPEEISWEIASCSGTVLLNGGAPFVGAVLIPDIYEIRMHDNYGDGWNGAYLIIDIDTFGFLSDVDWIATIGTWPQIYTDTVVDVGCLFISTQEVEDNYLFIPTEYYNLAGQVTIPNKTGIYIASDGYIRKLIYLTK